MVEYRKIEAGDLGIVFLRRNPRARRYLLRVENGHVYATIPAYGNERELFSFMNEQHGRLLHILQKASKRLIFDENTEFRTFSFSLRIICTSLNNLYSTLKEGVLYVSCPLQTDFSDERIQEKLRKILENALRYEAKRILPVRLKELAGKHGFQYTSVKINNSRTHWGSCTTRKSINLSLSVMLLPEHLLDYILLHELCHTVEMNHSERFWSLMNRVTDGKVPGFREEMKSYRML